MRLPDTQVVGEHFVPCCGWVALGFLQRQPFGVGVARRVQQFTRQVVLMQPLHDQHDAAFGWLIEAAEYGLPHIVHRVLQRHGRIGVGQRVRIVDDDVIGTSARRASDPGGKHGATIGRSVLLLLVLIARQLYRVAPETLIPRAAKQVAPSHTVAQTQITGMRDEQPLRPRLIASPLPGGPQNRNQRAFTHAWRNIDDQPSDLAEGDRHQVLADRAPVHCADKRTLLADVRPRFLGEAFEIIG